MATTRNISVANKFGTFRNNSVSKEQGYELDKRSSIPGWDRDIFITTIAYRQSLGPVLRLRMRGYLPPLSTCLERLCFISWVRLNVHRSIRNPLLTLPKLCARFRSILWVEKIMTSHSAIFTARFPVKIHQKRFRYWQ